MNIIVRTVKRNVLYYSYCVYINLMCSACLLSLAGGTTVIRFSYWLKREERTVLLEYKVLCIFYQFLILMARHKRARH